MNGKILAASAALGVAVLAVSVLVASPDERAPKVSAGAPMGARPNVPARRAERVAHADPFVPSRARAERAREARDERPDGLPSTRESAPSGPDLSARDDRVSEDEETSDATARLADAIRERLDDADPDERVDAIRVLVDANGLPDATAALAEDLERLAFADPSVDVRRYAAQALALAPEPADHDATYRRLLSDPDWAVRANASLGLARTGDAREEAHLLALVDRMKKEQPELARNLVRAVDDMNGEKAAR